MKIWEKGMRAHLERERDLFEERIESIKEECERKIKEAEKEYEKTCEAIPKGWEAFASNGTCNWMDCAVCPCDGREECNHPNTEIVAYLNKEVG